MTIPSPPECCYPTWEACLAAVDAHAQDHGYSLRPIWKTKNKSKNEVTGYQFLCDKAGRPSTKRNITTAVVKERKRTSKRCNCPFSAWASIKANEHEWRLKVNNPNHNHPRSSGAADHLRFRKPTEQQLVVIRDAAILGETSRQILQRLILADPSCNLTVEDVNNKVQYMKRQERGDYSDLQAVLKKMEVDQVYHKPLFLEGKLRGLFWAPSWGQQMWRRYPDLLTMDATYKISKYGTPFFEVAGVTGMNTTFNVAYAMIPDECDPAILWVMEQLEELRIHIGVPQPPYVTITDFQSQTKTALSEVWGPGRTDPEWRGTQQQLCIWHIMKNVRQGVNERYTGKPKAFRAMTIDSLLSPHGVVSAGPMMSEETAVAYETDEPQLDPDKYSEEEAAHILDRHFAGKVPIDIDPNGVLTLWRHIAHTPSKERCQSLWEDLEQTFAAYPRVVKYLRDTYWDYRQQWCNSYIKEYRNYGRRASSVSESAHAELKSYLDKPMCTLLSIYNLTEQMNALKQRKYEAELGKQQQRNLAKLDNAVLFSDKEVKFRISWPGLLHAQKQYALAFAAHKYDRKVDERSCTKCFETQFGIPCWHSLHRRMYVEVRNRLRIVRAHKGKHLTVKDFDSYWWLERDMVSFYP